MRRSLQALVFTVLMIGVASVYGQAPPADTSTLSIDNASGRQVSAPTPPPRYAAAADGGITIGRADTFGGFTYEFLDGANQVVPGTITQLTAPSPPGVTTPYRVVSALSPNAGLWSFQAGVGYKDAQGNLRAFSRIKAFIV